MLRTKGCSDEAWRQRVARVREGLNRVAQEILGPYNVAQHVNSNCALRNTRIKF